MKKSKTSDFPKIYASYIKMLCTQKGLSKDTIDSYSKSIELLVEFYEEKIGIKREKLHISNFNAKTIEEFFSWLETNKNNCANTRNQRKAGINSFFRFLQHENLNYIFLYQQVISIPRKKTDKTLIKHLNLEEIEKILEQIYTRSKNGKRDLVMLATLYETAARVTELSNIKIKDIHFSKKGTIIFLYGKGKKERPIPITSDISKLIKNYINYLKEEKAVSDEDYIFLNRDGKKLSRAGIASILSKYVNLAKQANPNMFKITVSPHIIRHSRAMHWLQAGIDIWIIKDLLGHEDIKTTEIYARQDVNSKRASLELVHPIDSKILKRVSWNDNISIMEFVKSFNKE